MIRIVVAFLVLFSFINLKAQVKLPFSQQNTVKGNIYLENDDCTDAIWLEDTIFGPFHCHGGYGDIQEFKGNTGNNLYYFPKETNSAWYKFKPSEATLLTFEVLPTDKSDDVFCYLNVKRIVHANKLPVRTYNLFVQIWRKTMGKPLEQDSLMVM